MNDTYEKLLDLIIEEKDNRNITIVKLSDMVGCDRGSMSNWLRGEQVMPAQVLFKCLEVLGYPIVIETYQAAVERKRVKI